MEEIILRVKVDAKDLDNLKDTLDDAGVKFEEVQDKAKKVDKELKGLDKHRGTLKLLDQYTGGWATKIAEAVVGFRKMVGALNLVKGAIIATGIGLLVVALGTILNYWDEIETFITGSNVKLIDQIELKKDLAKEAENELNMLEASENILRLQGKTEKEILDLKKDRLREIAKIAEAELQLQKDQLEFLQTNESTIQKSGEKVLAFFTRMNMGLAKMFDAATGGIFNAEGAVEQGGKLGAKLLEGIFGNEDDIAETEKRIAELELKATKARDRIAAMTIKEFTDDRKKQTKVDGQTMGPDFGFSQTPERTEEQKRLQEEAQEALMESAKRSNEEFLNSVQVKEARQTQIEKDYAKVRERIAKEETMAKLDLYGMVGQGFQQLGDIVGRQTVAGKGLAIAGALISTYSAIAATLEQVAKTPAGAIPGYAIAQSIVTGLAGLAAVKNIASVKVPGGGGGGGAGGLGGGGRRATAPTFNVVDNNPQNQLNQSLLEQNQTPIKAFVTEGEVSTAQELSRSKVKDSSFG